MNLLKIWYKKVFGPKYDLTVSLLMKSGVVMEVLCDDIKIKTSGNDLVSYEFIGMKTGSALFLRMDDVSSIRYTRN